MRRRLRKLLREAKKLRKDGETGKELFAVKVAMWAAKLDEVRQLVDHIDALKAERCQVPFEERRLLAPDAKRVPIAEQDRMRAQASHKQETATDADLEKFHAWAAKHSSFAEALIVAEFTGCRGAEFDKGIRIEATKFEGVPTLRFHIESAKCDGKKKGLELRCHEVPFPAQAADSVKRRWLALAQRATKAKSGYVLKIEAIGKSTAGRRITEACRTISEGAGVKIGAYSLRNRFSSQVKASSKGKADAAINVALALGHQTTETQRHYARAHRGGGGISPVTIKGVNVMGTQIRGPAQRKGPPLHIREKVAFNAVATRGAALYPPKLRL